MIEQVESGYNLRVNPVHVFRSASSAPDFYEQLFAGIFRRVGLPEIVQQALLLLILTSIVCLYYQWVSKKRVFALAAQSSAVGSFVLLVFLSSHPWDELFVNLRHSLHLSEGFGFSFNRFESIEATVDFLPYFTIGLLAKLGLPLVELALLQSLFGGFLCLFAARAVMQGAKLSPFSTSLGFCLLCIFPPLIYNSGHAMATTLFAASLLWSLYFLFISPNLHWGLFWLSMVPLIRLEGAFFVAIAVLWIIWESRAGWSAKLFGKVALVALPTLLLTVYRWIEFGSPIPLPVTYKQSLGSLFYLKIGMRNFMRDFVVGYGLCSFFVCLACWATLNRRTWDRSGYPVQAVLKSLIITIVFILPYYLAGGDWFPSTWGRYLFPLTLLLVLSAILFSCWLSQRLPKPQRVGLLVVVGSIFLTYTLNAKWNSWNYLKNDIFGKEAGRGGFRIGMLSQIGLHFNRTTAAQDRIASSEIATIMYFADREAIDLLGVANPRMVTAPLQENPNLVFRRRDSSLIEKLMPEYLWAYDYTTFVNSSVDNKELALEVGRRHSRYLPSNEFRFGGIDKLRALGYQQVVVLYANDFSTLYWVKGSHFSEHRQRLLDQGFQYDELEVEVPKGIS